MTLTTSLPSSISFFGQVKVKSWSETHRRFTETARMMIAPLMIS
jgi:hypothetical protein